MVINLNGHTITGIDNITADSESGYCKGVITEKNIIATINIAKHAPSIVYNWKYDATHTPVWYVATVTQSCENEDSVVESDATGTTTYNEASDQYEYSENGTLLDKKAANTEIAGYELDATGAYIVSVNGKIQHANGLPVVKAVMKNIASGATVDPTITVTEATNEELSSATVYEANGTATTDLRNSVATCTDQGAIVYKVVVTDPDGKIAQTKYLRDDQALDKVSHEAGALYSYKILTKNSVGFDSEEAAKKAGGNAVVKVTSEKVNGQTEYFYWSRSEKDALTGTKSSSINASTPLTLTADQIEEDGSFTYLPVYYCNYEDENKVNGEAVVITPYANATSASENNATHSSCKVWKYANISITYEFSANLNAVVKTKYTYTLPVSPVNKPEAAYSHLNDGTEYGVVTDPTCATEGTARVKCAICGENTEDITVKIPKLADTFGSFPSNQDVPAANVIDSKMSSDQVVSLNADRTEATIAANCTKAGGVYKYCTGDNNKDNSNEKQPHWVKQSTIEATGHDLSTIVVGGTWNISDGEAYNKDNDYTYTVQQQCKNPGCTHGQEVTYHSVKGKDSYSDVYSAIEIIDEDKGADCQTAPKTIYTVKGLTDTIGNAISKTITKTKTDSNVGDHVYAVTAWNWSTDFETATITGKCTVKGCNHTEDKKAAKVTQTTAANGITTYTATFGENTDTKTAYSLKKAKVTYDTSAVTDANLVTGIEGAAPQVPDVTVTINGTVIDSNAYTTTWTYTPANKQVVATVNWTEDVKNAGDAEVVDADASTKPFNVAASKKFSTPTTVINENGEEVTHSGEYTESYDPESVYSVVTSTSVKGATVKYAVTDKDVTATASELKADPDAVQKKIEALDFNLDAVENIKDAGLYYVYAQISAEGYTTYTAKEAKIVITKKEITVYIDDATIIAGETPDLNIRAVESSSGDDLNIDKADFVITTVGGQELNKLTAGTYKLHATATNYKISTANGTNIATLTVLAKDGSTVEEQTKADQLAAQSVIDQLNALTSSSSEADVKAAIDAYNKLTDTQKAKVDSDASAKAKLTSAQEKVAAADQKAADQKAADAVIKQLNALTSSSKAADAQKAIDAYNKLTADQKKIVDANSAAMSKLTTAKKTVAASKLKASKVKKVTPATKTIKYSKLKKKAQSFKLKVKKTGNGKVTFKKASGNKNIKISKAGKVTIKKKGLKKGKTYKVKVKVTIAKTKTYKKATATKTFKIKVK